MDGKNSRMVIKSLSEYIDGIKQLNSKLIKNGVNKNEIILFRGHSNNAYQLEPSISRKYKNESNDQDESCEKIFNEERNLIESAKNRLPDVFRNDMLPLELLALLQHYGIPTRLLDVTENALVALYFACSNNHNKDGEVICFKHNELSVASYPIVQAVADSYRLIRGFYHPLSLFYDAALLQPYFLEHKLSCEICESDDEFKKADWVEKCAAEIDFVFAPIRSFRQQAQQGRYILFVNKIKNIGEKRSFCPKIEPISKSHKMIAGIIKIPKETKKQILLELSLCGIRKDTLFCDNIDIVCSGILDKFKEKRKIN